MIRSGHNHPAVHVRLWRQTDRQAWDAYVESCPAATVFHQLRWSRAVERAYGHKPCHLTAWRDGRLVGVLPMFLVHSLFVGRVVVSVPYATYGGVAADSEAAARELVEAAKRMCRDCRANYLELRHRDPVGLDLPEIGRYDTFRKALPAQAEDVLSALPRKTRTAIRTGLRQLGDECATFGPKGLEVVYDLYAWTLRRLGSPNYRRALFQALAEEYGQDCVCLVVRDGSRPIAGVISFVFRDEIVPYFSGSLPAATGTRANNVMYLKLMEYAVRRGLKTFDFNRTRRDNHGPYDFKRHHGFEPSPLHYQAYLAQGRSLPNLSPSNRKFALAGRVWRRLPLWMTRSAGARITKWIP